MIGSLEVWRCFDDLEKLFAKNCIFLEVGLDISVHLCIIKALVLYLYRCLLTLMISYAIGSRDQ